MRDFLIFIITPVIEAISKKLRLPTKVKEK